MSSLPNPSHLSSTPVLRQRHRHRRSAAISGDFDSLGLGLLSPHGTTGSFSSRVINDTDTSLDNHFKFNNDDDFTNKPKKDKFSFPHNTPDLSVPTSPFQHNSLSKRSSSFSLNSPIKMCHSRSKSNNYGGSKFFATEETHYNSENVPEAVIDLDRVLNASLYVTNKSPSHKRTELAPADIFGSDELLCSPFMRAHSSPYMPSPSSANPLCYRSIQEQATVEEEEEEEEEEEQEVENENIDLASDNDDLFVNPQDALSALYSNSSANSSSSSLRSTRTPTALLIEKTVSNSSKESYNMGQNGQKRSGAMANRYQSIYDQSYRISNALRISSSESINIIRSNSSGSTFSPVKEARLLGHSSSLPSLKSNQKRNATMNPSRFSDYKNKQVDYKKSGSNLQSSIGADETTCDNVTVEQNFIPITNTSKSETFISDIECPYLPIKDANETQTSSRYMYRSPICETEQELSKSQLSATSGKVDTNSPISINSDMSSTILSINGTIQSADSSLASNFDSKQTSRKTKESVHASKTTPSIVISKTNSCSLTTLCSNERKEDEKEFISKTLTNISERDSFGITAKKKSEQDQKVTTYGTQQKIYASKKKVHPSQERILKLTKIPSHKASNKSCKTNSTNTSVTTPAKMATSYYHSKSKSLYSFSLESLKSRSDSSDDASSLKIRLKKDKFLNWFKRSKEP